VIIWKEAGVVYYKVIYYPGVVIGYWMAGLRIGVRVSAGAKDFSFLYGVYTGSGAHLASYSISTGAVFLW
jgi:hypothetical protein